MLLLNFTHPLTPAQHEQIEVMVGQPIERMLGEMVQFDTQTEMAPQIQAVLDALGLDTVIWQTVPLVVNLPGHAVAAATLLAELHGRMGHFPAILRMRPVAERAVTQYEVAEVINLQALREQARTRR